MGRDRIALKTIFFSLIIILSAKTANNEAQNSDLEDIPLKTRIEPMLGVLDTNIEIGPNATLSLCIMHFNEGNIAHSPDQTRFSSLKNLTSVHDICMPSTDSLGEYDQSIIMMKYDVSRCPLRTQVNDVKQRFSGAKGILWMVPFKVRVRDIIMEEDDGSKEDKDFFMGIMREEKGDRLVNTPNVRVRPYSPPGADQGIPYSLDMSIIVIWLMAVGTLVIGSYWSGVVGRDMYLKERDKYQRVMEEGSESRPHRTESKDRHTDEEQFLQLSPSTVLFFVMSMSCMLLSLYFFYNYLVQIIIGLFVVASIGSTFRCMDALSKYFLPLSILQFKMSFCSSKIRLYQLVIVTTSLTLSLTWYFTRKKSYSWVLQDLLGTLFSINMLRTIRLPSYRICTILLSMLFFYDIFFVFLTPLLTKSGESVMVEVATGGSKGPTSHDPQDMGEQNNTGSPIDTYRETLPMVLRVPHLSIVAYNESNPLEVCYKDMRMYSQSLLGFGDILVPGLLVSYCHAFDLIYGVKGRAYFVVSSVFYGLGLIVTFVALFLMNGSAQPALLYLVPFTVIPPLLLALCRGQLHDLWNGLTLPTPIPANTNEDPEDSTQSSSESPVPEPRTKVGSTSGFVETKSVTKKESQSEASQ